MWWCDHGSMAAWGITWCMQLCWDHSGPRLKVSPHCKLWSGSPYGHATIACPCMMANSTGTMKLWMRVSTVVRWHQVVCEVRWHQWTLNSLLCLPVCVIRLSIKVWPDTSSFPFAPEASDLGRLEGADIGRMLMWPAWEMVEGVPCSFGRGETLELSVLTNNFSPCFNKQLGLPCAGKAQQTTHMVRTPWQAYSI